MMARIRSIHPGLFTDDAFMSISMPARILFIGLWTEADDDGVFDWKPISLKARILPADHVNVAELLDEIEASKFVTRFTSGGASYGAVRNFRRFQRPKKPNTRGLLPDKLRTWVGLDPPNGEPIPHQFPHRGGKSPQMEGRMEDGREEILGSCSLRSHKDARAKQQISKLNGNHHQPTEDQPQPQLPIAQQSQAQPAPNGSPKQASDATKERWLNLCKAITNLALEKDMMPPDTGYVGVWQAAEYDPKIVEAVVLPIMRTKRITTLNYCDRAILEAHQKVNNGRQAARANPVKPVKDPADYAPADWITHGKTYKFHGEWPTSLGPEPGRPGCRMPEDMQREYRR